MSNSFLIKSPCKINLSLLVHNRRDDGFHNLTSIFQLVDLWDELEVIVDDTGVVSVKGDFNCPQEDNLIYKSIWEYKKKSLISNGFKVVVKKNVPSGGGLGGGSGNAGSVLRFLNSYFKRISHKDLLEIALKLGSDIPFFLSYPTALVQGRGENISKLHKSDDYYILLVNPGIHISTSEAFKAISRLKLNSEENQEISANLLRNYEKGVKYFHNFKNSFENALHKDYNFINEIKNALENSGADFVSLSGSGSTMFGIFTQYETAKRAKEVLSIKNYKINLVKPLYDFYEYVEI